VQWPGSKQHITPRGFEVGAAVRVWSLSCFCAHVSHHCQGTTLQHFHCDTLLLTFSNFPSFTLLHSRRAFNDRFQDARSAGLSISSTLSESVSDMPASGGNHHLPDSANVPSSASFCLSVRKDTVLRECCMHQTEPRQRPETMSTTDGRCSRHEMPLFSSFGKPLVPGKSTGDLTAFGLTEHVNLCGQPLFSLPVMTQLDRVSSAAE
jgi:hypothetical protein